MSRSAGTGLETRQYFLHTLSPLHAGIGAGVGAVNLPTAREQLTGYPYLPGSSLKGALREAAIAIHGEKSRSVWTAFGPPKESAAEARGGVVFSDANLVCLPVRSLYAGFAWVTAPIVLRRLARDAAEAYDQVDPSIAALSKRDKRDKTWLFGKQQTALVDGGGQPWLEDVAAQLSERTSEVDDLARWLGRAIWPEKADQAFFAQRLIVVPNDVFSGLSVTAMEVRTRVKIDPDTGTAAASGPWSEEHMPAESILAGLVVGRRTVYKCDTTDNKEETKPSEGLTTLTEMATHTSSWIFGGKTSVGMGRTRLRIAER